MQEEEYVWDDECEVRNEGSLSAQNLTTFDGDIVGLDEGESDGPVVGVELLVIGLSVGCFEGC